ncbi:hybrid sensor histidine kinase/response regulator [Pseudodesulfovibrio senegalensis]|uniref:Sensory/regulatory protein RpfC n=1 Tax=Pseudodesulfovibrio senegalensis TaxID=1721087 RepID=A0A6N6N5M8_9BACT|nr:hybrid sensor histidine kinase/response regulator [Pseudodesulfovibrio senegalensis]KAB1442785.1 response regulator [Pseudodesulfovibrio senegalensis]
MFRVFWAVLSCLGFLTLLSSPCAALELDGRFDRLNTKHGLSQSHVLCMIQDSVGFIWIGNYTGLNRYDGKSVKIYKHDLDDEHSLSDHNVRSLLEDSKGRLWVGTKTGGLNLFDRSTETFRHFKHDPSDPDSLSGNSVRALYEDSRGRIWVGTFDGLNRFDPETGTFTHYKHEPADPKSLSSNEVRAIREDADGHLWVGTEKGLNRFHPKTGTFTRFLHVPGDSRSLRNDVVLSLFAEKPGELWVGTEEGGLSLLDMETGAFRHFLRPIEVDSIYKDSRGVFWVGTEQGLARRAPGDSGQGPWRFDFFRHNPYDPKSLPDNEVRVIFEDHSGVLWIGTYGNGACRVPPKMQAFGLYRNKPWDRNSLAGPVVPTVWGGKRYLWIGNLNSGLNRVDRSSGEIRHFSKANGALPTDKINYICGGTDDLLWVGTLDAGLLALERPSGRIKAVYRHEPDNPRSLSMDNIWYVLEDSRGDIWAGTSKRGLNRLDRSTGIVTRYLHSDDDPASLSHNRVRNIYEDSQGTIWVGTNGGLNRFDPDIDGFTHWRSDPDNPNALSNDRVTPIVQDVDGKLWVGTDMGLNRLDDPEKGIFSRVTMADGLASDAIQGMQLDADGHLWGSTFKGLFRLDPKTRDIVTFEAPDGLQGNEFWMDAYTTTEDGAMAFGGTKGLTIFHPDNVRTNTTPPPVVITGFKIMNKPARLPKSITWTKNITISHEDSFFSFSFAALDYHNPEENHFQYMLEGFDREWVDAGTSNVATYTNFDHGHYVFRVRAANSDGVWNETGASVELVITPPYWKTWWFRVLFLGAVFVTGYFIFRRRVRAIEQQRKTLIQEVDARTEDLRHEVEEHKKTMGELREATIAAEEANTSKSVFLTTMSHEIRTPLNAIIGTADLLTETDMSSQQMRYVELLQSSGETLLAIINDILDFSKIEAGQVHLENIRFRLRQEVENAATTLSAHAGSKGLELLCRVAPDVPDTVQGDPTRLRQVLLNLLSNAVKFTESGEVMVDVAPAPNDEGGDMLLFTVRDTGVGIDPRKLDSVFDVFHQADSSTTRRYGGTGLGLAICRRLVGLMGGRIWVSSEPEKGSVFSFTARLSEAPPLGAATVPDLSNMLVLVVDDNASGRGVLREILELWGAEVREASNAEKAMQELQGSGTRSFDILFVDQLMPGKDGIALTRSIRDSGDGTPVVILSQGYLDCSSVLKDMQQVTCCQKPLKNKDLVRSVAVVLGQPSETGSGAEKPDNVLPPMRILVAEDNPSNREIVRLFLSDSPVTVDMTENGEQALKRLEQNHYDVVLMDMEMPVMDGYEATTAIRAAEAQDSMRPYTPVVALTAHSFAEHRDRCHKVGCDDYLVKPVKKDTLRDALLRFAPAASGPSDTAGSTGSGENPAMDADATVYEVVPKIFRDLIPRFLTHSLDDCRDMETALSAKDYEEVRRLGHKVGGAAYGFGMTRLGKTCKLVETLAEAKDDLALRKLVAELFSYFDKVEVSFE